MHIIDTIEYAHKKNKNNEIQVFVLFDDKIGLAYEGFILDKIQYFFGYKSKTISSFFSFISILFFYKSQRYLYPFRLIPNLKISQIMVLLVSVK